VDLLPGQYLHVKRIMLAMLPFVFFDGDNVT
jgi:hypothetical protein